MGITNLYVIGNGFDLHHGINSSYRNFKEWLQENYSSIYYEIDEAYNSCDDEWWSDFENNLASIDAVEYSYNLANEYSPDLTSDRCDDMWNSAAIEVENRLSSLYNNLRECFHEWITQLKEPQNHKRIRIEYRDSLFLTFNYTKTLETMYEIDPSNNLHIHGCIDDDNEDFILGHGRTKVDISRMNPPVLAPPKNCFGEDEETNEMGEQFHEELAREAAIEAVASQQKPVNSIIKTHKRFFNRLKNIQYVHIYGFSFSKIDIPYLDTIVKSIDTKKTEWEISDHNGNSKDKILAYVSKKNITKYKIIDLLDIIVPSQSL